MLQPGNQLKLCTVLAVNPRSDMSYSNPEKKVRYRFCRILNCYQRKPSKPYNQCQCYPSPPIHTNWRSCFIPFSPRVHITLP